MVAAINSANTSANQGTSSASSRIAEGQESELDLFAQLLGMGAAQPAQDAQLDVDTSEGTQAYWFDLYDQLKGLAEEGWEFDTEQPLLDQLPPDGQYRVINVVNQLGTAMRDEVVNMMRQADGLQDVSVQLSRQLGGLGSQSAYASSLATENNLLSTAQAAGGETLNFMQAMERIMSNAMTPVAPALHQLESQDLSISSLQSTQQIMTNQAQDAASSRAEWAPVKLDAQQQQWGQQLVSVLKERVELQMKQDVQHARIRLDPPQMGALDLAVKMEGGKLNVQINVSDPALREALQQSIERLRADLDGKQLAEAGVNVDVGEHHEQPAHTEATMNTFIAANDIDLLSDDALESPSSISSFLMHQDANRIARLV